MTSYPLKVSPTIFVVKNNSIIGRTIKIFNHKIRSQESMDLMNIPGVSEAEIRNSLLKGELYQKLSNNTISVISSNIDLTQFDDVHRQFLESHGVTSGLSGNGGGLGTLSDGSVNFPGLAWTSDSDCGLYRIGNNQMAFSVGATLGMEIGNFTTTNTDPISPAVVRYAISPKILPLNGVNETAAYYYKMDHSVTSHVIGIYGEVDAVQARDGGSFTKVIHLGQGDAHYVAIMGEDDIGSVGMEVATWSSGSINFLASAQAPGCENSKFFNALWEQDTLLNYGAFYAEDIPNNSFVIEKRAGAADGYSQFVLYENGLTRTRFELFNDGSITQKSLLATSGNQLVDSPEFRFRGAYWNGSTSVDREMVIKQHITAAGASELRLYIGGVLPLIVNDQHTLDLQQGNVVNCVNVQSNITTFDIWANGQNVGRFTASPGSGSTGVAIIANTDGGGAVLKTITVGAADSGGSGFRVLRVAN